MTGEEFIIEQGSIEWHMQRLGKVTASRVADIVRKTKTGVSATRATYMGELIAERLSGLPTDGYKSAAMQWGSDYEQEAVDQYVFMTDAVVEKVGFVAHPKILMSGASPDRYVGTKGLLEMKCPLTATHVATLLGNGTIAPDYLKQMQWQMACTGREWCDWCSYDPRLPASMRLHIQRVKRDNDMIRDLEAEVVKFIVELDETIHDLRERYESQAAA